MKNKDFKDIKDVTQQIYDELFEHATHLLNDHSFPVEMVAGTMMAIAQRLYKTHLDEEEYEALMEIIKDAPIKPYGTTKIRLH